MDLLRQRRPRGERRRRLPADLHRPDADDRAVVGGLAQDPAHLEAEPHHLARRLHRLALRQERAARRPRHRHRGDRHPSLHLAAAEGGVEQLHDPRAVSRDHHARQGRCGADPPGHGAVGGFDPRRLHHRLRHAPSRRGRAPPGHGGRDRVRIAGEAAGVSRRRGVRHLRHVRRLRRPVRARGGGAQAARDDDSARGRRRRLRELGLAHDPVDDGDHVPAAPVPGRGDRERRREAPQQGDLAVPALHARDQRLRAADRLRRPAALSGRQRGRRYLRAHAADGREAGAARPAGVHRGACRPPPAW